VLLPLSASRPEDFQQVACRLYGAGEDAHLVAPPVVEPV
jgi:hypothetical protein